MRPVNKGKSPINGDYEDYDIAFPVMRSRIGPYCSYCERIIHTNLAIEHIQPKNGPDGRPDLIGNWDNFLLGCVNCNSTKGAKKVELDKLLLPDRDNTAFAFDYTEDGKVEIKSNEYSVKSIAENLLVITGLDKPISKVKDSNRKLVAIDRVGQRMEAWLIADDSKSDLSKNLDESSKQLFRKQIIKTALSTGHFSIWMKVFQDDKVMRKMLIKSFPNTANECFHPDTTNELSPRPKNHLEASGKI